MKIFISQPMNGKTYDEIISERIRLTNLIKEKFSDENITFIHSFVEMIPRKNASLFFLARSLELLSNADFAVFAKEWKDYRGCRIEHLCCKEYGIPIWIENS